MVVLRLPHLVLADVGDDERTPVRYPPQTIDHVGSVAASRSRRADSRCRDPTRSPARSSMGSSQADRPGRAHSASNPRALRRSATSSHRHLTVFEISARIHLDVDLLCARRERRRVAGHAIVKAHAARDDQIGILDGVVDPRLAVMPIMPRRERMRRGKPPSPSSVEGDGMSGSPAIRQLFHRAIIRALARRESRELRRRRIISASRSSSLSTRDRMGTIPRSRLRSFKVKFARRLLRILGDVDQPGRGPRSAQSGTHRIARDLLTRVTRKLCLVTGSVSRHVDFLKRIRAQHLGRNLR